jgi:chemotaxis protein methyltransferase CheR
VRSPRGRTGGRRGRDGIGTSAATRCGRTHPLPALGCGLGLGALPRPGSEILEHELLPTLLAEQRRLTVWAAGCADGSELYSVAILLERLGALDRAFLLGSDVLEENLALARQGVYGSERMSDELRVKLRWEQRDIVSDGPPEGSWRLILCRNLAIYLAAEAKDSLHQRLAAALAPGGVLMLGRSERLSNPRTLGLEASGAHVYRRLR